MPLYPAKCESCEKVEEHFYPISRHDDFVREVVGTPCECGGKRFQLVRAPQVMNDIPGYECPVTGEYVTSRSRRKQIIKEHNLLEVGDYKPPQMRDE